MKFALISHRVPPSGTGQSLVIYRMLRELSPEAYCVISTEQPGAAGGGDGPSKRLPAKYHHLPPPPRLARGHRFGLRHLREGINIPLAVLRHARRIGEILREEKCGAVVACTGDVTLLPAGYLAARRAGLPFYAYLFDHYSYREWQDPAAAFWARRFEPWVTKGAAGLIAPNEVLSDDLRDRFGVEPAVIHNSFDISPYEGAAATPRPAPGGEVKIVYTGDIYEAHYDAFRNLMAALGALGRPEVRLHVYTDKPDEELAAIGVAGPVVRHPQLPMTEMPRVQMEADLLFLPLAFNSPYPDLVRTSATTKLGEYLAARRPILVHAPAGSFVCWYCSRYECGVVVDEDEAAKLAEGIGRVLADEALRRRLGENAWERARADFDVREAREAFARLVGLEGGQGA